MRKFISFSLAVGIIAAGVVIQPALAKTPNDTLVMAWSLSIYRTLDPADVRLVDAATLGQLDLGQPALLAQPDEFNRDVIRLLEDLTSRPGRRRQSFSPSCADLLVTLRHVFASF